MSKNKKIEVVKWVEKRVGDDVVAVWLDRDGKEIDPAWAFYKGSVDVRNNSALTALTMPTEVGGSVYVHNNSALAALTMPTEVGGSVDVRDNSALAEYSINTKTRIERLRTNNHQESIRNLIAATLLAKNILFADGIMSHIISSKNNVFKIRVYGKKEISYCVYRDGNFSHGKTVKEAIESLRYKVSTRNMEEFKSWRLTDIKTVEELISAYRSITGACSSGVRGFCESITLKDKMSVAEVLSITSGKYGHEIFKNFEWAN
jgi:hypothetical protein